MIRKFEGIKLEYSEKMLLSAWKEGYKNGNVSRFL